MYTKVAGCPITEQTVIYAQLKRSMPELSSNLTHLQSLATSCANPKTYLYTLVKMVVALEQLLAVDLVSCPLMRIIVWRLFGLILRPLTPLTWGLWHETSDFGMLNQQ